MCIYSIQISHLLKDWSHKGSCWVLLQEPMFYQCRDKCMLNILSWPWQLTAGLLSSIGESSVSIKQDCNMTSTLEKAIQIGKGRSNEKGGGEIHILPKAVFSSTREKIQNNCQKNSMVGKEKSNRTTWQAMITIDLMIFKWTHNY